MRMTPEEALDLFQSDDLVGIGMAAHQLRKKKTDARVATYQIDRNINYTNFCTEYCSFCAFYRPMGAKDGYVLSFETIAEKIEFFAEARRQGIEPLILFMIDPGPKSAKAYTILRHWLAEASLLPVRNQLVARGIPHATSFPNGSTVNVSLEIPLLGSALKPLVEQPSFSFTDFWRTTPVSLPVRLDDELRAWIKRIFLQFREIELWLMCEDILSSLK